MTKPTTTMYRVLARSTKPRPSWPQTSQMAVSSQALPYEGPCAAQLTLLGSLDCDSCRVPCTRSPSGWLSKSACSSPSEGKLTVGALQSSVEDTEGGLGKKLGRQGVGL